MLVVNNSVYKIELKDRWLILGLRLVKAKVNGRRAEERCRVLLNSDDLLYF